MTPQRAFRFIPQSAGRRVRSAAIGVLAGLVWASAACREPAGEAREVTREEFIETYATLLRVEAQATDSADARQRRTWVLERRGLTAEDLERFAERHADDPAAMADIWKEIESRIRALQTGDTAESGDTTPDGDR